MQTDFQQAMKHRRAVSRDEQQMQALMESEPDKGKEQCAAVFMDSDAIFGHQHV